MTDLNSVCKAINETDGNLNTVIQSYLDGSFYLGAETTVAAWRIENYSTLRKWAYPNPAELNDAQVKINSGISELVSEGEQQLEDYTDDCLNIKTRFPKE